MREDCKREGIPEVASLLKDVPGVEVLQAPFPGGAVAVRPTGRFSNYAFLISHPRNSVNSRTIRIHFEFGEDEGEKRSSFCYGSACLCCLVGEMFERPVYQRLNEDSQREYLGLSPLQRDEEALKQADADWFHAVSAETSKRLVDFCLEKEINFLFARRPKALNDSRHKGVTFIESKFAVQLLFQLGPEDQIRQAFSFIRSCGSGCCLEENWLTSVLKE